MTELKNQKDQLEAALKEREEVLSWEKEALIAVRQELERHVTEYASLDQDLLRKSRMHKTFAEFCLSFFF